MKILNIALINITLKESGTHIGWCEIGGLDFDHNEKNENAFFYLIGKGSWRKSYDKEATVALLDYAFNVMG